MEFSGCSRACGGSGPARRSSSTVWINFRRPLFLDASYRVTLAHKSPRTLLVMKQEKKFLDEIGFSVEKLVEKQKHQKSKAR